MISAILIIFNLFLLESMLSIDNAAILSLMVKRLPVSQQKKSLRYGILGAFLLRGLSLFFISWLNHYELLRMLGAAYLICLAVNHFASEPEQQKKEKELNKTLWQTILMVELIDLSFSIDNILASTAITNNLILIYIGVFMGIIAMRFVSQWFITLMNKYPSLERSAYIVIFLLGIKQVIFCLFAMTETHFMEILTSSILILVFLLPIFKKHYGTRQQNKEAN